MPASLKPASKDIGYSRQSLSHPASKLLSYNISDFAQESLFTPTEVSTAVSKLVRGGYKGQNALNAVKALQGVTLLNPDTTLEQAANLSAKPL